MASAEVCVSPPADVEGGMSPGEFVLKKLFAEFVALSERKLQHIASQPLVSRELRMHATYPPIPGGYNVAHKRQNTIIIVNNVSVRTCVCVCVCGGGGGGGYG